MENCLNNLRNRVDTYVKLTVLYSVSIQIPPTKFQQNLQIFFINKMAFGDVMSCDFGPENGKCSRNYTTQSITAKDVKLNAIQNVISFSYFVSKVQNIIKKYKPTFRSYKKTKNMLRGCLWTTWAKFKAIYFLTMQQIKKILNIGDAAFLKGIFVVLYVVLQK